MSIIVLFIAILDLFLYSYGSIVDLLFLFR